MGHVSRAARKRQTETLLVQGTIVRHLRSEVSCKVQAWPLSKHVLVIIVFIRAFHSTVNLGRSRSPRNLGMLAMLTPLHTLAVHRYKYSSSVHQQSQHRGLPPSPRPLSRASTRAPSTSLSDQLAAAMSHNEVLGSVILARNGDRTECYQHPVTQKPGSTASTPLGEVRSALATLLCIGEPHPSLIIHRSRPFSSASTSGTSILIPVLLPTSAAFTLTSST